MGLNETTEYLLRREEINREFFYGVYRGIVEWNQDPIMLGRVKVRVPMIHGLPEDGVPMEGLPWCITMQNTHGGKHDKGSYNIPDVGSGVIITFEGGNLLYPICLGAYPSYPIDEQVSEPPIEAMTMIDDKPSVKSLQKTDVSHIWNEKKEKLSKMIMEHFPEGDQFSLDAVFGINAEHKKMEGGNLEDIRVGNERFHTRMSKGKQAGIQMKSFDSFFDMSQDGDEIKISLFGTHIASMFIDKATGELKLSFKKVTIASDTEIMGNLTVLGTILGG